MKKQEAWRIYRESLFPNYYWENEKDQTGLLLSICTNCGEKQTRETYCQGFWLEFFTLIQDYAVTAIARHKCGQWHRYVV